jgi:hypothetical protein
MMTTEELNQVIKIMLSADGGCKFCASSLLIRLDETFPGNTAAIKQAFLVEFEEELELE